MKKERKQLLKDGIPESVISDIESLFPFDDFEHMVITKYVGKYYG